MDRYEIFCTAEQTAKAIQLGAPIKWSHDRFEDDAFSPIYVPGVERMYATVPTATKMIGWLEEQDEIEVITISKVWGKWYLDITCCDGNLVNLDCETREEATLKAIDAALNELTEKSKMDEYE